MQAHVQPSVLLCGNSTSLNVIGRELPECYGVSVVHLDPSISESAQKPLRCEACLLVYDQNSADLDFVADFQIKNPNVPVVCVIDKVKPHLEVSYREGSRIETSGLPQVLQVLESKWMPSAYSESF